MANKYRVFAPNGFNIILGDGETYKHGEIVVGREDLHRRMPRIFIPNGFTDDHVFEPVVKEDNSEKLEEELTDLTKNLADLVGEEGPVKLEALEDLAELVEEKVEEMLNEVVPKEHLAEGAELLHEIVPPIKLDEGQEELTETPKKSRRKNRKK